MSKLRHDLLTVLAIGMTVYLVKNVVHELIGHGGVAVAVGAVPTAVSSAWWDATYDGVTTTGRQWVRAGGTIANLALAAIALALWPIARTKAAGVVYFVWLTVVANALSGGGYMMVDPVANFGDWGAFLEALENPTAVRFVVIGAGIAISLFAVFWGRRAIVRLLPVDEAARRMALRQLCWGPYVVGSSVFVLSAVFNPGGPVFIATVAAATFGGTAWLAWFLPFVVKDGAPDHRTVNRSIPWLIAGGLSAAVTLFVLGPSIQF